MAIDPNLPGGTGAEQRPVRPNEATPQRSPSQLVSPPSSFLQVFLVIALMLSVAAFVADQWTASTGNTMEVARANQLKPQAQRQRSSGTHAAKGDEALAKKNYVQAVSEYRLALQEENQPKLHEKLGRALFAEGNPAAAFAQFREAIQSEPLRTETYIAWGQDLISLGKPDEAARLYQEALKTNPKSGLLHYDLAAALQDQQKNAEAVQHASLASGNTDQVAAAANQIQELSRQALQEYAAANQMGVDLPGFWYGFGQLLVEEGKFPEAEACLKRAVNRDPSLAAAYSALALAEFRQGKYADAIGHYEAVLALLHDDPATLDSLARLYVAATNTDFFSPKMAAQLATRACDATGLQNAHYLDTVARSYAAAGDFLAAISWEDKAAHRATQLGDRQLAAEFEARYELLIDHRTE
jgi:tetratricopeptide (TPR) repeat protein